MSQFKCPNCHSTISKPTSPLSWILAIVGILLLGAFLVVVVCLTAIASIGDLDEKQQRFDENAAQVSVGEFSFDKESKRLSYSN